jgi:hypothetical protein
VATEQRRAHLAEYVRQRWRHGHPLGVLTLTELDQCAAQSAQGRPEAMQVVPTTMQSSKGLPETVVQGILVGEQDVQLLRPRQLFLGAARRQVGEPPPRLLSHRSVFDAQIDQARTVIQPAIWRYVRSIDPVRRK